MLHVPVGFRGSESGAATIGGTKWGMPCRQQQMVDDPDAWSLSAALLLFQIEPSVPRIQQLLQASLVMASGKFKMKSSPPDRDNHKLTPKQANLLFHNCPPHGPKFP